MGAEMAPGSDVEHHHHHPTGHRWLDITLGVSAIFISLMSLLLALQHGRAMEKMVEVSSWPYALIGTSDEGPDGKPRFAIEVFNKGVGPARIESVEVWYAGVAQTNTKSLLRAMLKITDPNRDIHVMSSTVVDMVLPARESVTVVEAESGYFSPDEYQTLSRESSKLHTRICYCSVFNECSVLERKDGRLEPEPVKACPVPKTMFLQSR